MGASPWILTQTGNSSGSGCEAGASGMVLCGGSGSPVRVREASHEVVHEAMTSGPIERRPRRSSAARWRLTAFSTCLVAVALLAHLLIAIHTVSHLSQESPDVASQHCVICAIGKHSAGIAAGVIPGCQYIAAWVVDCADPPVAPPSEVADATLARGPPFSALAALG